MKKINPLLPTPNPKQTKKNSNEPDINILDPLLPTPNPIQTLKLKCTMILPDIWGIGYRGRCLYGVVSLKDSHRLTRVTGSSTLYQCMERILFPVLPHYFRKWRWLEKTKTTGLVILNWRGENTDIYKPTKIRYKFWV